PVLRTVRPGAAYPRLVVTAAQATPPGPGIGCPARVDQRSRSRSDRMPPKEDADGTALFKAMMAFTGTYRLESDDKFITDVDLAWHPAWNGTQQVRFFKVDGD